MLESINSMPKQNNIKIYIDKIMLVIESTLLTTTLLRQLCNNETCEWVSDVACDVSSCGEKLMKVLTDWRQRVEDCNVNTTLSRQQSASEQTHTAHQQPLTHVHRQHNKLQHNNNRKQAAHHSPL